MFDFTIDAGHGGMDPGAIGPTGLKEKDITLRLTLKVAKHLIDRGVKVNYTRIEDKTLSLSQRAAIANNSNSKYFLSIHINAAENINATGTETFAFSKGTEGEKLATSINNNLVRAIGLANRGVKFNNFAVLRETKMPATLTEVCFISNPKEEAMLKDEIFLDKTAEGIAKGMIEFLGLKWEKQQTTSNVEKVETVESNTPKWQLEAFQKLIDEGIIEATGYWEERLDKPITAGEMFAVLSKMIK
jgi:N-acetylmuramoyl-L-alanine amidase